MTDTTQSIQSILVPVSIGELIDKITILLIKAERITDQHKLKNIQHELKALQDVLHTAVPDSRELGKLTEDMKQVNIKIWDISEDIRTAERNNDTNPRAVQNLRDVHVWNDKRAAIKKEINLLFKSDIIEEKSYPEAK